MVDTSGMSKEARAAYEAARELISKATRDNLTKITFNDYYYRSLTIIPPEIASANELIHIDLDNTKISDLSPIGEMTRLRILWLNLTRVRDLFPIRKITGLQSLSFNRTEVRDLSPIVEMKRLVTLSLNGTDVRNLWPINDMKALEDLSIDDNQISDLSPVSGMTSLRELSLNATAVSDLDPLRNLTSLRSLYLDQTSVSDLSPLRNLTSLARLSLDETKVSDLRPLERMDEIGKGFGDLWYSHTPAVQTDPNLERLAQIQYGARRAKETIAYLKTLPPWPEPLPWLSNDSSKAAPTPAPLTVRPDPPLTRAGQAPKTPTSHVKFLLSQPRLTQFTAKEVAAQIRWALRDVKRATNSLPEPLATIEEIADALDDLGNARLAPKDKQRIEDMKLRIAQLEAMVEKLTAQLSDSEKARETAEALARSQSFGGRLSPEMATEAVKTGGFVVRAGIVTGAVYFLGVTNPAVAAMLGVLAALK